MKLLFRFLTLTKMILSSPLNAVGKLFKTKGKLPAVVGLRTNNSEAAILFVHGFSGTALGTWGKFPSQLLNERGLDGWDVFSYGYASSISRFETVGIWSADPPIERLALGLRTAALLPPLNQYKSIAIIAHSMGGLVVQEALAEQILASGSPQLVNRVSHVILFGSPSGGLKNARLGYFKPQIKDMGMGPDGFFQRARPLWDARFKTTPNDPQGNHPFQFLVVAGDQDEFVPSTSSLAPFHSRYQRVVAGDHLSIVKPGASSSDSTQLVVDAICKNSGKISALDSARVAVELGNFHQAIQLFGSHPHALDMPTLVQYSLALDGVGRREEAVRVLTEHGKTYADALGALGGRLKRKWRVERRATDAEAALKYYAEGYDLALGLGDTPQIYYHAINMAFMSLLFKRDARMATHWAEIALDACQAATADNSIWRFTTEGECLLILGHEGQALTLYEEALANGGNAWELRSAYEQAYSVAAYLGKQQTCQELQQLFGLPALT